ncbi:GNAT family N-acetyltransferase [Methanosarcina sp. KYL-1]|uniref:GNAT family N-acetyltransferase n=1 Tax=Methanosarcina sp. KYL-1 TaxID=2602068 RepID=UPI0021009FAF|nr:GNAT family N-acetyltransferase [Methanosarcina sp. KYL-1]MCQ1536849.1 GNAT family N-acetyltransferase [Methanosarcina sp. KYL-1]
MSGCKNNREEVQKFEPGHEQETGPLLRVRWTDGNCAEALEDAYQVRREVFIKEQEVPEEEEIDEADLSSHHVIVYENTRPIATGRLVRDEETWLMGRISVLKEYRGKQVGKLVVEKLLEKAAELKAGEVHIHAQTHAVGFYGKLGFVSYGDTFPESGIEHICMKKKL